jgi:hypothetical protein
VINMPDKRHYVFSARTTEAGLTELNELKKRLNVGWDELVVDAMCGHYNLDRSALMLPRVEKPTSVEKPKKAKKLDKAAFIRAANEPTSEVEVKSTATDEAKPKSEPKKKPKAKKAKGKAPSTATVS